MLCSMDDSESSRTHRRLELVATLLLAFATVGTAWAAYQAREWTGEQSQGYSRATANRIAVNRESAIANRQVQIDVATFIQWVDAQERGNTKLADFYRQRFRDEFEPAFAAWLATDPLTSPNAPETPFAMPEYRLAASTEANRLEAAAAHDSNTAKDANERANGYMQNHYNLVYREEEREMIPQCIDQGIAILPWSPLARGLLAGNRTRDGELLTTRARTDEWGADLYVPEVDFAVVDRAAEVAAERGVPTAQVALAWLFHRPGVTAPIVGATKVEHLDDAIAAERLRLSEEEMARLEEPYLPHAVSGH